MSTDVALIRRSQLSNERAHKTLIVDAHPLPRSQPLMSVAQDDKLTAVGRRLSADQWSPLIWVPLCMLPGVLAVSAVLIPLLYVVGVR